MNLIDIILILGFGISVFYIIVTLPWNDQTGRTIESITNSGSPYREPAEVESYQPDYPVRFDRPFKKKREPIVLPKSLTVFLLLVPAMLTDIGLGFAYDSSSIGVGAKWGMLAAGVLTNFYFIASAIAKADA